MRALTGQAVFQHSAKIKGWAASDSLYVRKCQAKCASTLLQALNCTLSKAGVFPDARAFVWKGAYCAQRFSSGISVPCEHRYTDARPPSGGSVGPASADSHVAEPLGGRIFSTCWESHHQHFRVFRLFCRYDFRAARGSEETPLLGRYVCVACALALAGIRGITIYEGFAVRL